jgi:transketolase
VTIDGHDFKAIDAAIAKAKATKNGKPSIIIAKTIIGKGIPEVHTPPSMHTHTHTHTSL